MRRNATRLLLLSILPLALSLGGCMEQLQTTRTPPGSLGNFLIHLEAGELDDARAYFAPGLVTPSAALDASLKDASDRLRAYEVRNDKYRGKDLGDGRREETISAEIRPKAGPGTPTPATEEGWQRTDILVARMAERGPGWRILDFQLVCCPAAPGSSK